MTGRPLPVLAACLAAALAAAGCGGGSNHTAFNGPREVRGTVPKAPSAPSSRSQVTAKKSAAAGTPIPVTESDYAIRLGYASIPAGKVEFDATNAGTMAHELVVIRTDRPADRLPVVRSTVDTAKAGKVEGRIPPFPPLHHEKLDVELKPGHYVLICNLIGHYQKGMHADFTVR